MYKNIFIDRYKQVDIIEDYKKFLKRMEELKLYKIKFDKYNIMKLKVYFSNYIVERNNQ